MSSFEHPIRVAALRSGLSPHVIRVWEKRYGVIRPDRTNTNRRTYSDEEIERLTLLARVTQLGHGIGNVAQLSNDQLLDLIRTDQPHLQRTGKAGDVDVHLSSSIEAIKRLDPAGLESVLKEAVLKLGHQGLLRRLIAPLTEKVGELWRDGTITAAHEHFASAIVRNFLAAVSKPYAANSSAPLLIVATPAGQLHELGATIAATAAATVGWRTVYLGPSLPAAEIAGAALQNQARAVALSIVYPEDDPLLPQELKFLRQYLPPQTAVITGGRAALRYGETLEAIGAMQAATLEDLYTYLDALRTQKAV